MRRYVLYLAIVAFLVLFVSHRLQAAEILFMYNPVNPDLDDFLVEWMEDMGHEVTLYDTAAVNDPDEQIDLALEADLVYVAESLGSTSTHDGAETYIKEVPTPQIWAEAYAWDEAAMTGDFQFEDFGNTQRANPDEDPIEDLVDGQTEIVITNPDHPMAAGLSGSVQVYEEEYSVNWGLIETMGDVTVIATLTPAAEYAALFVYDEGAELEDGTPAAGERIGLFLGQAGLGAPLFENIHSNGLALIEAAMNYALGESFPLGDFNQNNELDVGDLDEFGLNHRQCWAIDPTPPECLTYDVNMDSKVDLGDLNHWVKELKGTWIGDANLDLEFNSSDLVAVFAAGEYEDAVVANSGWATGDWNADTEFSSGDLVAAFTDGGYNAGLRPTAAVIPEPSSAVLLLLAALGVLIARRTR